ncbi:hypothetical protein EB796_007721 [Bugula neritina]|uniref:GAS2L1 n=1 Tax=Bugula neritina TaxID=10212 RepID=A0A7J7K8M0_BUGNE|nr:hypothetical protein EB796_007721 [Bugula neritina]
MTTPLDSIDCESLSSTVSSPPSPHSPISPTHSLHRLDRKSSVRPYHSRDAYLYAMREDLAVWFNDLYSTNLTADNLLDNLQDGSFLCLHANNVKSYIEAAGDTAKQIPNIVYRTGAKAGSFQARDNLANFINWVKNHLGVNDVLLFESDDLVMMKNEKNVVLCLLEVARRGARYGMLAPMLVQFEQEIDEMEQKMKREEGRRNSEGSLIADTPAMISDTDSDKASLDEWVQSVVQRCTCPKQFPLVNVSRGKYRIGFTQNVVFVRILRNHVMIRVGGGWDTLEHYLDKHDPCRCRKSHNTTAPRARKSSNPKPSSLNSLSQKSSVSNHKDRPSDKREKSLLVRSKSVASLESPDAQSTPLKTKSSRSGSTDLLSSDLLITRDDTGRHVIDDTHDSSPPSNIPPNKTNKSFLKQSKQSLGKPRHSLGTASCKGLLERSKSPSYDLRKKWKDSLQGQNPHSSRPRSQSRSRTMSSRRSESRDSSSSRASPGKTMSLPRNRHMSLPNTARSRVLFTAQHTWTYLFRGQAQKNFVSSLPT